MELMRIRVVLEETLGVDGGRQSVRMIRFTGDVDSPLFKGRILPGGVDTQTYPAQGEGSLSARYMLEGVDCAGQSCKMYIDNRAAVHRGGDMITTPRITTDSQTLRWLETAALTGRICPMEDHLEIVISHADTPAVKHMSLQRGGLTLRGRLERLGGGRQPLVLMLHGFGGHMDAGGEGIFQRLSDALVRRGMATLRFDFNGHGASEGDFTAMTPYNEIEDAAAFLAYAQGLDFTQDIYVLGHSQGGVIAGMLAGYYPDMIKKLVMLAPAASLKTDAQQGKCMQAVYDAGHIPPSVLVDPCHEVGGLYFRMAQSLPIYEVTGLFRGAGLAVACGRDTVVEEASIRQYALAEGVQFKRYSTLDHGMNGEDCAAMVEDVAAFLGDDDGKMESERVSAKNSGGKS